jgi:solute carrier family 25 folate transporter 32
MRWIGSLTSPNLKYATIWRSFRTIIHEEGVRGLYRGLGAGMLAVPIFWSVYFPIYQACKAKLGELDHDGALPGWLGSSRFMQAQLVPPHAWIPGSTDLKLLPRRTVTESGLLLQNMASAVAAGAVSDVVTNPLWVVRLRLQVWPTSRPHNASPPLPPLCWC